MLYMRRELLFMDVYMYVVLGDISALQAVWIVDVTLVKTLREPSGLWSTRIS